MHTLGASEVKNRLAALLDEVEGGAEFIITRHGKPIARLAPLEAGFSRAKARLAAEGLRATSRGQTLGGLWLKELIVDGRR
ncbi:type II toxin-antitoxin system prevent-host-death family antitoxin [Phenylobacterium sp.]|uniref:type II toxin-antitoxin system Phd/YefM family antitoxin n=1 Tax=Phenylobacterium sp. TaxID=1871053 RepID=UPI00286E81CB|nr:type II toxin-antitoxin system prevent-host-death family antitoxin [Phenylobacterium sp.]